MPSNTSLLRVCAIALSCAAGSLLASAEPARGGAKPFLPQARLEASDAAPNDSFGYHLSLSADGRTLAVGAARHDHSGGVDAGSAYVFTRNDTLWTEAIRLQASDAAAGDLFGVCAAISNDGNTLAVSAHYDDNSGGEDAGSVYIFTRAGGRWSERARIQASDAAAGDHFGTSLAFTAGGRTLAVGAHYDDHPGAADAGSVYLFTNAHGVWQQSARVEADDAAAGDYFGVSVAFSGDGKTLAASAYGDDRPAAADAGSAYVFRSARGTWRQEAHLVASDAAAGDTFGTRIALSGDGRTLVAGAYFDDHAGRADAGSVYLFRRARAGWREEARLQTHDAAAGDHFGSSVAISRDGALLAAGAYGDDHAAGADAGSVYLFSRVHGRWEEMARLEAADAAANDSFGMKVALSADALTLAVGAFGDDTAAGADTGSVSVFAGSDRHPPGRVVTPSPGLRPASPASGRGTSGTIAARAFSRFAGEGARRADEGVTTLRDRTP
jgi:hypothetical protein